MVAHIDVTEAQAWAPPDKLTVSSLDANLESGISTTVLAKLAVSFPTSGWTSSSNTPSIVRKIIAMEYVATYINRAYATDEALNEYAAWLFGMAESLIQGLVAGTLSIDPDAPIQPADSSTPVYYPTDASSAQQPTTDDPSLGGPAFTLGRVW
jgi:hypothetical protein